MLAYDGTQRPWRRFVRVSASPHPTLAERLESQLRKAGLHVLGRAERPESASAVHQGFLLAACTDAEVAAAQQALGQLGRVTATLQLRVL